MNIPALYFSLILVITILVVGFLTWIAGLVNNLRDSYTPLSDREIIAKGKGVNTRSAKAPEDCQHVKDFEKWKAFYRGETEAMPNNGYVDPAYYNKRAQVEAHAAAQRHKDDPGGDG